MIAAGALGSNPIEGLQQTVILTALELPLHSLAGRSRRDSRTRYAPAIALEDAAWEKRMSDLWVGIDDHAGDEFVALVDALAAELPLGSAVGLFERGGARDSTGHSDLAVPLYKATLAAGLEGEGRRRAVIQMASSMRNLGQAEDAVALLTAELEASSDALGRGRARNPGAGPGRHRARARSRRGRPHRPFCLPAALQPIYGQIRAAVAGMSPSAERLQGRSYGEWSEVFGCKVRPRLGPCRPGVGTRTGQRRHWRCLPLQFPRGCA
jgi:hypothetical protein